MMNKKALTLIEITISTVILALVMVSLVNLFVAGKRWMLHSRSRMTSAEFGRFFLDPLQMQVRQDQWLPPTNCLSTGGAAGCPGLETIGPINYIPNYAIQNLTAVAPIWTDVNRVTLTIIWNEPAP